MDALLPDEIWICIFEHLPGSDLKSLRLCQKHWSLLSTPLVFKKAIFCFSQPQDRQFQQFDFLRSPLTYSNNVTSGHLVRHLFVHHPHEAGSLAVLPRLNDTMPWIKHLDINQCRCRYSRAHQVLNRIRALREAPNIVPEEVSSAADSAIDVNAAWEAAEDQWLNLESIAIHTFLRVANGPRTPAASALVTHLNLTALSMDLDIVTFLKLPTLFPSLRCLSCSVEMETRRTQVPRVITILLLQHLDTLHGRDETANTQLMGNDMVWPFLSEMHLTLSLLSLDACYLLLALPMMAPGLGTLTYKNMYSFNQALGEVPMDEPLVDARAYMLSDGHPPSFKALQSLAIKNVAIHSLMASALFHTTQQLAHLDVEWKHEFRRAHEVVLHDYTPEHAFFRRLAMMNNAKIRHFAFYHGNHAIHAHQLLSCIDSPPFAHLVTLKIGFAHEICMESVLGRMPQLKNFQVGVLNSSNRENGEPAVKYPTRRVPHALQKMEVKIRERLLGFHSLENIENINPGTIHYQFGKDFCFEPWTMAPDQDDALFTWLAPDAQRMAMDVHHWASADERDVCLSWAAFPPCHLAQLNIQKPMMVIDEMAQHSWGRDEFGVAVVYQAEPGPGEAKLHLFFTDDDRRQKIERLTSELSLVNRLDALLSDLNRRQEENRKWRWYCHNPGQQVAQQLGAIGPATATVLMILATRIDAVRLRMHYFYNGHHLNIQP
ncbi:hypothetical protein BC940DRAFT_305333 [Gongronella butleri]|nr:hypothetical protein BC940DRAFT_305333 [Gongronella butleri]